MPDDMKMADDERRWMQARAVLDNLPDAEFDQARRRSRRRLRLFIAGVVIIGILGGVVFALRFPPADSPAVRDDSGPVLQGIAGLLLTIAGFTVGAVGLVKQRRNGQLGAAAWRAPTMALTRVQRKELTNQIRGRSAVDPEHLAIARDLARRMVIVPQMMITLTGLLMIMLGLVISEPSRFHVALLATITALFVIAGVGALRISRQGWRFLASHPEPGTTAPT